MYTQTIKLCPLDVYVCQFKCMNAFYSSFHVTNCDDLNILQIRDIHLIISRAADETANMSTLKIKSHNIKSLCVRHNPDFKRI